MVRLARVSRPVFAAGADLKAVACVTRAGEVFSTRTFGDLARDDNASAYETAALELCRTLDVCPSAVAHDMHPDYMSTRLAERLAEKWGISPAGVHAVQHHHAHIAAVLAEHGSVGPVIGVAFDGTGYGADGTAWGGEWLIVADGAFRRAAHLRAVPLPGGDRAASEVWRMAVSWLTTASGEDEGRRMADGLWPDVPQSAIETVSAICRRHNLAPRTSSMGRLFDAAAAVAGVRSVAEREAQAAIEFEAAFDPSADGFYSFEIADGGDCIVADASPVILAVLNDRRRGVAPGTISARFHRAVAGAIVRVSYRIAHRFGIRRIALGGGVFQNRRLTGIAKRMLRDAGFDVISGETVPVSDAGIAVGQAWVCAHRMDPDFAGDR